MRVLTFSVLAVILTGCARGGGGGKPQPAPPFETPTFEPTPGSVPTIAPVDDTEDDTGGGSSGPAPAAPTAIPTEAPAAPTAIPTEAPVAPTAIPTEAPVAPTAIPTVGPNNAPTGSVTCTGAVPAVGRSGSSRGEITCSGANDPDGDALTYALVPEAGSGACPSISGDGVVAAGTFEAAGTCSYRVRACDAGALCSSLSDVYTIASFVVSPVLSAPVVSQGVNGRDCNIIFPGGVISSDNVSGLTYGGQTGIPGLNGVPSANGIVATLSSGQSGGSFAASYGVLTGVIGGQSTTAVATSADAINYVLNRADSTLSIRTPAASVAGNTQSGRQALMAAGTGGACVQTQEGEYGMIVAGSMHSCALTRGGAVKCWGANTNGRLGNNSTTESFDPVQVIGLASGATAVTVGTSHSCALTSSGTVKCWGFNSSGQLGNNSTVDSLVPVDVVTGQVDGDGNPVPLSGVTSVVAGGNTTCALTNAGTMMCWGFNANGQLGDGTTTQRTTPVSVPLSGVTAIAPGGTHTCAISNGSVYCWGNQSTGRIGDGETAATNRLVPFEVAAGGSDVLAVAAGSSHTCILKSAGTMMCWGTNTNGRLGDGTITSPRATPVNVLETSDSDIEGNSVLLSGVAAIAVGNGHTCAIVNGGAKCWGLNSDGQLGDETASGRILPTAVVNGLDSRVTAIAAGVSHTCAIVNGNAICWGNRSNGRLGTNPHQSTPLQVPNVAGVSAVSNGLAHTCAIIDGAAKCWGANTAGQLGDGTTVGPKADPAQVAGLTSGVTAISTKSNHTCAIQNGAALCWGANGNGQLGNDSTTNGLSPVAVTGLSEGVTAISAGVSHTCAVKDGEVYCWGSRFSGKIGDNITSGNQTTPYKISSLPDPELPNATGVATGEEFTCVLKGGKVYCWGRQNDGAIGNGSTAAGNVMSPFEVATLGSDVVSIAAGGFHNCAIKSTGAMMCWGTNSYGQLGDNSTILRSTPVNVVTGVLDGENNPIPISGVTSISASSLSTCAISNGAAKCWGVNTEGQLGNGTTTARSVPTDVVGLGSGVSAIAAGSHACAIVNGDLQCWGVFTSRQLGPNRARFFGYQIADLIGAFIHNIFFSIAN